MTNAVTRLCGYVGRPLHVVKSVSHAIQAAQIRRRTVKAAYSVTMNIFRKKYFLFKSFVKVELSYVFTIKMFSTAENCMEK